MFEDNIEIDDIDLTLYELDAKYHDHLPWGVNCSLCGIEHAAKYPTALVMNEQDDDGRAFINIGGIEG